MSPASPKQAFASLQTLWPPQHSFRTQPPAYVEAKDPGAQIAWGPRVRSKGTAAHLPLRSFAHEANLVVYCPFTTWLLPVCCMKCFCHRRSIGGSRDTASAGDSSMPGSVRSTVQSSQHTDNQNPSTPSTAERAAAAAQSSRIAAEVSAPSADNIVLRSRYSEGSARSDGP
jgi:hypothetical protein